MSATARALALLVLWLAWVPDASALTVKDMTGRAVTLGGEPRRIVSLVPSATEIIFALGAEDRIAGVTDYCDFPPEARRKPSVGGMVNPSLETLLTLRPDLVIATPEGNRDETFAHLTRLAIPTYLVEAHRLSDVMLVVERLGELTGRAEVARALARSLERRVGDVRRAVAARPRPRVLYVVWPEPLIVPGREALVTELIQAAGGESVTADLPDSYPRMGLEAAVARGPGIILLATHGAGTGPVDRDRWDGLRNLPAIRSGRFHAVDGNLLHRYGPRVVQGLEALARLVHPEAFR